jgi:hypothetical protein
MNVNALHQSIALNLQHRSKYASSPSDFLSSELALAQSLQELEDAMAQQPGLWVLDAAEPLVGLLGHENVDIAGAAVRVIEQMVSVGETKAVERFCACKGLRMLGENIARLDQEEEEDLNTFDRTLGVIEVVLDYRPQSAGEVLEMKGFCEVLVGKIGQVEDEDEDEEVFDELKV